jgi:hypothetical protein
MNIRHDRIGNSIATILLALTLDLARQTYCNVPPIDTSRWQRTPLTCPLVSTQNLCKCQRSGDRPCVGHGSSTAKRFHIKARGRAAHPGKGYNTNAWNPDGVQLTPTSITAITKVQPLREPAKGTSEGNQRREPAKGTSGDTALGTISGSNQKNGDRRISSMIASGSQLSLFFWPEL